MERSAVIRNRFLAFGSIVFVKLCLLGLLFYGLTNNKFSVGYNDGYAPTQPIPFSHTKHAGMYKIDCKYCHIGVENSRHASVPSLNICMNCHLTVKTQSPHIQKIAEHYNENKPIQWKKVNLLPEFVKFVHAPHVQNGVSCTTCHGPVETMDKVEQHSSLSMGFCVNCHRTTEIQRNLSSAKNKKTHEEEFAGERKHPPVNCSTCHY